jgi:ssDNA-binding replication factor A large subunit
LQEDEPRKVVVRGEDIQIKTVTVSDKSGRTKVSLWRDMASSTYRPGDHVIITDVVINHYQNSVSLTTTAKSTIEVCQ